MENNQSKEKIVDYLNYFEKNNMSYGEWQSLKEYVDKRFNEIISKQTFTTNAPLLRLYGNYYDNANIPKEKLKKERKD